MQEPLGLVERNTYRRREAPPQAANRGGDPREEARYLGLGVGGKPLGRARAADGGWAAAQPGAQTPVEERRGLLRWARAVEGAGAAASLGSRKQLEVPAGVYVGLLACLVPAAAAHVFFCLKGRIVAARELHR
jgi:hypothetical protein